KLQEADALFTQIIGDPNSGTIANLAQFWKGEIAYRQSRPEDAIKHLNEYLKAGRMEGEANVTNANYILGYSNLELENYSAAIDHFKRVSSSISSQSSNLAQDAFVRTADAYFMQRNYATAKSMYQKVLDAALPQSDYSLYQMALIAGINSPA